MGLGSWGARVAIGFNSAVAGLTDPAGKRYVLYSLNLVPGVRLILRWQSAR
jgi:hypothetical protein